MPFFSVIVPTYNRAEKLRRSIRSVLDQTFADFELLVMDDGSTDHTQEVVEGFGDLRIRYEWAENSGGPATPRNRGIDVAQAEWMCFLDADDIWYPNKLEVIAQAIDDYPDSEVFCHNEISSVLATGRKSLMRLGPYTAAFYKFMLVLGNCIATSATTVRLDFINMHGLRFNQSDDYVIVEDYDLWLRIAFHGARFRFLPNVLAECIMDDESISANIERSRSNQAELLRDHVYSIQTFSSHKDKVWRLIEVRLAVQEAKAAMVQGYSMAASGILAKVFLKAPLSSLRYTAMWIQRQFRKIAS